MLNTLHDLSKNYKVYNESNYSGKELYNFSIRYSIILTLLKGGLKLISISLSVPGPSGWNFITYPPVNYNTNLESISSVNFIKSS